MRNLHPGAPLLWVRPVVGRSLHGRVEVQERPTAGRTHTVRSMDEDSLNAVIGEGGGQSVLDTSNGEVIVTIKG